MTLAGKVSLVADATSPLGRAIALALAARGADVALAGPGEAELKALAEVVGARGVRAVAVKAELGDPEAVERAVATARRELGRLDVAVCCADCLRRVELPLCEPDAWREVLDANLTAPYLICRAVLPEMLARQRGRIVLVAGLPLTAPGDTGLCAYASAKHGLLGLTRALAAEVGGRGVAVHGVCARLPLEQPLGERLPEEIARVAVWLADEEGAPSQLAGTPIEIGG